MTSSSPTASGLDPVHGVIRVEGLTKRFGPVAAVNDLSFSVAPGRVTGFLGPNGAGKTTTLRMLLGLATPDAGSATIGGVDYAQQPRPASQVGASLEAASFHPGRSARDHLRVYAPEVGVPDTRCDEVLATVGLTGAAKRRVGGFSSGMRQRLALATAILGDPQVLLLDEPTNGLDPEGIAWLRGFLRYLADQGRTILVSSHVLSEVAQTVDDVVIIADGRLVHESSLAALEALARPAARIVSPDADGLSRLITASGWAATSRFTSPYEVTISERTPAEVGSAAFAERLEVHELAAAGTSLESLFLELTAPTSTAPGAGTTDGTGAPMATGGSTA